MHTTPGAGVHLVRCRRRAGVRLARWEGATVRRTHHRRGCASARAGGAHTSAGVDGGNVNARLTWTCVRVWAAVGIGTVHKPMLVRCTCHVFPPPV
eukprot:363344-Chlamydomonas_euryale.AAC.4